MAKTGIEYAVFGLLQEDGTYKNGKYLSPVTNFNGTPTKASVTDYGDNRALETDNSVTGGTLSIEMNQDEDDIYVFLLGHTKDETSGEIIYNVNDTAPYVGCGAIGKSGAKYVAKFYKKVQFYHSRRNHPDSGRRRMETERRICNTGCCQRLAE